MKNLKILSLVLGLMFSFAGCGSSAPSALSILGQNANGSPLPQLNSIIAATSSYTLLVQGFNANNQYWVFQGGFSGNGNNYIAPADGIVTEIGQFELNGASYTGVTILHSGMLATRVIGMQVVDVRVHDVVTQGSTIGLYLTTGQVAFQVILNGVAMCPLSFLSTSFREAIYTANTSASSLCD